MSIPPLVKKIAIVAAIAVLGRAYLNKVPLVNNVAKRLPGNDA